MMNEEKQPVSQEALIRAIVGDAFELAGLITFAVGAAFLFNNPMPVIIMGLILAVMGNLGVNDA